MTKIINGKKYKKYDGGWGLSAGDILLTLIQKSLSEHKLYYMEINGCIILSDEDGLDSVYKKVVNKTWIEYADYVTNVLKK